MSTDELSLARDCEIDSRDIRFMPNNESWTSRFRWSRFKRLQRQKQILTAAIQILCENGNVKLKHDFDNVCKVHEYDKVDVEREVEFEQEKEKREEEEEEERSLAINIR